MTKDLSRRGFLTGSAAVGALAAFGLAGFLEGRYSYPRSGHHP